MARQLGLVARPFDAGVSAAGATRNGIPHAAVAAAVRKGGRAPPAPRAGS